MYLFIDCIHENVLSIYEFVDFMYLVYCIRYFKIHHINYKLAIFC